MGHYELIVIIDASRDEEATQQELVRIGELVKAHEGELGETQSWGRRRLVFEIKGHKDGLYASIFFRGGDRLLAELDRGLKLNENVLRHLVLCHDTPPESATETHAGPGGGESAEVKSGEVAGESAGQDALA